ncbi:MAG TPA: hypothetical protein PKC51_08345, partial [Ferruginibacter sp.]|nr:hypothetical protein [Ferruginibacter sp.]
LVARFAVVGHPLRRCWSPDQQLKHHGKNRWLDTRVRFFFPPIRILKIPLFRFSRRKDIL